MTRRTYGTSAAEMDRMDAIAATRQPPKPPAPSADAKVISALRSKLDKQKHAVARLQQEVEGLKTEKAMLLLDLNNERAAHERLRKMARGEG